MFSKKILLHNIRRSNIDLAILSTGVKKTTNLMGDMSGYGTVWFHPGGIANILQLSKLAVKYRVCYNSTNKNEFLVHLPRGEMHRCQNYPRGLFYSDITDAQTTVIADTVHNNRYRYSGSDYFRALEERKLQYKVALNSHRHLIKIG